MAFSAWMLLSCGGCGLLASIPPDPPVATLIPATAQVYRQPVDAATTLAQAPEAVQRGDGVSVDTVGEGQLLFLSGHLVRLFYSTVIQKIDLEVGVDQNAPPTDKFGIVGGNMMVEAADQVAKRKLKIENEWLIVEPIGTSFFLHYDQQRAFTWIIVTKGVVRVTIKATGQTIDVPAQWQFWYQNGQPVQLPVPATRPVIDALLGAQSPAPIDIYAPNALRDGDLLANRQCTVTSSIGLNLRAEPDQGAALLEVMADGERFEAMGRLTGQDGAWLYGLAPSGQIGWAFADFIGCEYEKAELPERGSQAPPPVPASIPPTATPTPTPTVVSSQLPTSNAQPPTETPTPTNTPTPTADTREPIFVALRYAPPNPPYTYYSGGCVQSLLEVVVELDATIPPDAVQLQYQFVGARNAGQFALVPMQPGAVNEQIITYSTVLDLGKEGGPVLQGIDGKLELQVFATRVGSEFMGPSDKLTILAAPC
jgi:hypothetical protein